ncbi:MAG: hypothetical protein V4772_05530 [Pseudomonadota bacterium]
MLEPFFAVFAGTAVEFFETAAIVYAIARAGYPKEALSALVLGHLAVLLMAIFLLPLQAVFPVFALRLLAGLLLLSTGLYWSLKSWRRMLSHQRPRWAEDPLGKLKVEPAISGAAFSMFVFFVTLKSSLIEAGEILLLVFPVAAPTAAWHQAFWGVATGIATVSAVMLALHGQLKKVPEVKLKLATGLVLSALGLWWLLELYLDTAL